MAKGKKTGGRDYLPGHNTPGPGRPPIPEDIKLARSFIGTDHEKILHRYLYMSPEEAQAEIEHGGLLSRGIGKALLDISRTGDVRNLAYFMDRIMGRPKEILEVFQAPMEKAQKTFTEFCEAAGYPPPYPKQIEMVDFGFSESVARLLLGARGYGKTDYVTILGVAYKIYLTRENYSCLVVTKEKKRCSAIVGEIAMALKANGVQLEKENASCVRVAGRIGKDHSVEGLSIKASFRGRHPDIALMDDPVTEEDTSEAMRELVEKKYSELLKLTKNVLIIGQPAHKHDLYAKLRPLIKIMEVPHGTIPELDHDLEAMMLAGVDPSSIEMSYHLKVPADDQSPFARCKYIDGAFPTGNTVAFIDPSFEGGDYTAMTVLKAHMDGVAVYGKCWKKAWNHCIDDIQPIIKKFNVKKLCFETNSLGDMPIEILRKGFADGLGIVGRKSNGNKHSRIMAAGTYAHLIHLSKESDKQYLDQVVKYEYKAEHDDAPDSLASCLEWVGLIRGKK